MTAQVLAELHEKPLPSGEGWIEPPPVIAWYRNGAKTDCDFNYNAAWNSVPDKSIVMQECGGHVKELRDRAAQLRGVRGEGLMRKKVIKALKDLEERLACVRLASSRYGLALCARNFYRAYERHLIAA